MKIIQLVAKNYPDAFSDIYGLGDDGVMYYYRRSEGRTPTAWVPVIDSSHVEQR